MRIEYRKKALISEADQNLVFEMIKKFVLAWDPDFTKLTPKERMELEKIRSDQETVVHDEIDWD